MPFSVIEFQDPTGEVMVMRIPYEGSGEFVLGSQLIVEEGQVAVFFRDGRLTDGFKPGRYTLDTGNLSVLSKMLKLATFGLKSPFRACVYFVQLRTFTNMGWGTQTPVLFRDTEFRAVHLRANGAFSVRVASPSTFLRTLVANRGFESTHAIEEFMRRAIVSRLAGVLPGILSSVLDLPQHYQDIEVALKKATHDDFEQYGLKLVDLFVEAITVPPDVQQMIDRAAGSRALSDNELNRYQSIAMSDALRDAAKQPGGSEMGSALGLGAGIGMGQQLAGSMQGAQAPGQPVPPPPPPQLQWYFMAGGQRCGPVAPAEMQRLAGTGEISASTQVWRQGLSNWAAAGQVPELAGLFQQAPPPPPPPPNP